MREHRVDEALGLGLDPVGERLDRVGAGEGVDGLAQVGLGGDDLLGAQREPGRGVGGQGDGLVVGVGVQRLGAAHDGGERLDGDPGQVDLGLLRGELDTGGLGVEAELERARVGRAEALAHDAGPQAAGGAELGDLGEDRRAGHEEERQAGGEGVDVQTGGERAVHVLDAVGEGERELLRGGGPGLGHVVAGDRDRVPPRQLGGAVREGVADQAQARRGREDVGAARDVLLEDVVLDRAAQLGGVDALLLGDELVEQQQDRGGGVDGHRGGDLAERDAVEQGPHVIERVDRDADLADLPGGLGGVGVVAHLRRQVEGDAQPGGAVGEEVPVAPVGLGGGGEAGVLAHRPGPGGVHGGVDAAGVRERSGLAEPFGQVGVEVFGAVDGSDLDSAAALRGRLHPTDPNGSGSGAGGSIS